MRLRLYHFVLIIFIFMGIGVGNILLIGFPGLTFMMFSASVVVSFYANAIAYAEDSMYLDEEFAANQQAQKVKSAKTYIPGGIIAFFLNLFVNTAMSEASKKHTPARVQFNTNHLYGLLLCIPASFTLWIFILAAVLHYLGIESKL